MLDVVGEFAAHVAARGDETFMTEGGVRLTFAETDAAADDLAWRMREAGLAPGDAVAWIGASGVARQLFHLATLKAGCLTVMPDLKYPDDALREMMARAGAKALAAPPAFAERAARLGCGPVIPAAARPPWPRAAAPFEPYRWRPEETQTIVFTSGSTGAPKSARPPMGQLLQSLSTAIDATDLGVGDTVALLGNPWQGVLTTPFATGARAACFDVATRGTALLADWLAETGVTCLHTYPAIFRQVLAKRRYLPDLKAAMLVGEPLTRADAEAFSRITRPGAALANVMGSMELSYFLRHDYVSGDPIDFDVMPLGRELSPDLVRVVDEDWNVVPDGSEGELVKVFRYGPAEMLDDPDAARRVKELPDGRRMHRTGDMAWRDFRGVHHGLGRRDNRVKIRGYNVRMPEVEFLISELPGVSEAAVGAIEDDHGIRRLACWHVGEADAASLRESLSRRLPNYMVPSVWRRCEALPKTATGKVRRVDLPDPLEGAAAGAFDGASPTESTLAEIFRSFLGGVRFGREDDFFDLGGDSLQAMELLIEIEKRFGRLLPLEGLVLRGASVVRIAEALEAEERSGPPVLKAGHGGPLFVCAHTGGGQLDGYLEFAQAMDRAAEVLGVRARGMDGGPADGDMAAIAAHAVAQIPEAALARSDLVIVGFSFGAAVATEMARQVAARGGGPLLVLLDPGAPWLDRRRWFRSIIWAVKAGDHSRAARLALRRAAATLGWRRDAIEAAHWRALVGYRPEPLPEVDALLVHARNRWARQFARAWRERLGPRVELAEAAGDHADFTRGRNAGPLAQQVQGWVAATLERRAASPAAQ